MKPSVGYLHYNCLTAHINSPWQPALRDEEYCLLYLQLQGEGEIQLSIMQSVVLYEE